MDRFKNCKVCGKELSKKNVSKTGLCYAHSRWQKGQTNSGQFKKGQKPIYAGTKGMIKNPLKGKKMPEEWREKLKKPKKYVPPWTDEHKKIHKKAMEELGKRHLGENHPRWKGGKRMMSGRIRKERLKNAEGNHTNGEWELLKKQYGYKCPCCKRLEPMIKLTEDHIIPLSKGGSNFIENIQPLCLQCNARKFTKIIKY